MLIVPRYIKTKKPAEFADNDPSTSRMLMVGDVVKFAVVHYRHTKRPRGRGSTLFENEVVMVRVKVFEPQPRREGNLYIGPKRRAYRPKPVWVPAKHITAFLCEAPDRAGDVTVSNFVTVQKVVIR